MCRKTVACNRCCLAGFFLFRVALHEIELVSSFRNALQQLTTPLHRVSPLQQPNFGDTLFNSACTELVFIFIPTTILNLVQNSSPQLTLAKEHCRV